MRLSSHSLSIRRDRKSPRDDACEVEEYSLCEHAKKYVKWDVKRTIRLKCYDQESNRGKSAEDELPRQNLTIDLGRTPSHGLTIILTIERSK